MKKREWTRVQIVFIIPLTLFFSTICLGASMYTALEGWSYIDAVYFAVSTATTLGYGDFVPQTIPGKLFTIIYAFIIISLALYFFTLVGKYFIMEGKRRELVRNGRIKHNKGIRKVKV